MAEEVVVWAPCNQCGPAKKHSVIAKRVVDKSDDIEGHGTIMWRDTYEMLECCGCEGVMLRHTAWFSEEPEVDTRYYPPRISRHAPTWKWSIPASIAALMNEIYAALHNDSRRLVLMGARAIVDLVITDKVGDDGTFTQKINKLETQGFIGKKNCSVLAAALDAGSAAAHRGHCAKTEDVELVMDIVENLLQAVYVLESAAEKLRKSTPSRKAKSK